MGAAMAGYDPAASEFAGGFGGAMGAEFETGAADAEVRGWVPKRGLPQGHVLRDAGLGAFRATTATASSDAKAANKGGAKGGRGTHRRGGTQQSLRSRRVIFLRNAAPDEQRKTRIRSKGYMTESERAFQKPTHQRPSAEELAQPMRSIAGRKIHQKRVDLAVAGEADGVIPQDDPCSGPTHEICEIFPEKFVGAAGTQSGRLFKQRARDMMARARLPH